MIKEMNRIRHLAQQLYGEPVEVKITVDDTPWIIVSIVSRKNRLGRYLYKTDEHYQMAPMYRLLEHLENELAQREIKS